LCDEHRSPYHEEAISHESTFEEQLFMSDPRIQDLFQKFKAKQPMGSRPSSSHVANMEDHLHVDPSIPLEGDARVLQHS